MAVMGFESGYSTTVRNGAGSGAVGLIQFMPDTARGLGTTTAKLAQMAPLQQLDYVEKYFKPYFGRVSTFADMYMTVLYPAAIGKADDFALFTKPSKAYRQNSGLDADGNGEVTKSEAAKGPRRFLK